MHGENLFDCLVDRIYEGAIDQEGFAAFCEAFRERTGARVALINCLMRSRSGYMVATRWCAGYSPEDLALLQSEYASEDPYAMAGDGLPVGTVAPGADLVDYRELEKTRIQREFYGPRGIRDGLGALLHDDGEMFLLFLAAYSPREDPRLPDEVALVRRLVPHLQRASKVRRQLHEALDRAEMVTAALEHWPVPVLLVDSEGRIEHLNERASRLLDRRDGLQRVEGRLVTSSRDDTTALNNVLGQFAVSGGVATPPEPVLVSRADSPHPLCVQAMPLPRTRADAVSPTVLVVVGDLENAPVPQPDTLAHALGLTATEAKIAHGIAAGSSVQQVADNVGIGVGTARNHLKRVFYKTNTQRQGELIHRILTGVPLRFAHAPQPCPDP